MPNNFAPRRVLVVDDDTLIRWCLAEMLGAGGHVVTQAADGATALRAVTDAATPFDVVLLDYHLPDSHDLTLLAHLRRLSPTSGIVLMTAYGTPDLVAAAQHLGVWGVLNKPFDMQNIGTVVSTAAA